MCDETESTFEDDVHDIAYMLYHDYMFNHVKVVCIPKSIFITQPIFFDYYYSEAIKINRKKKVKLLLG